MKHVLAKLLHDCKEIQYDIGECYRQLDFKEYPNMILDLDDDVSDIIRELEGGEK